MEGEEREGKGAGGPRGGGDRGGFKVAWSRLSRSFRQMNQDIPFYYRSLSAKMSLYRFSLLKSLQRRMCLQQ